MHIIIGFILALVVSVVWNLHKESKKSNEEHANDAKPPEE